MPFEFLSDEWIDAVLALQDEYRDRIPTPEIEVSDKGTVTTFAIVRVPSENIDLEL